MNRIHVSNSAPRADFTAAKARAAAQREARAMARLPVSARLAQRPGRLPKAGGGALARANHQLKTKQRGVVVRKHYAVKQPPRSRQVSRPMPHPTPHRPRHRGVLA